MSTGPEAHAEAGPSRKRVEIAMAALLLGFAALALWDSYSRGAGWDGGPQSGFFPARVGWILFVASGLALISAFRRPDETFASWTQLKQVAQVFAPLALYVAAIPWIGIYVASALFMALFMIFMGSFRWWSVLAASALVPLVTFWVFEIQFKVLLPKGPLEAWLGY